MPVKTLDGRTLKVRVDEVVSPTTRKIIEGEGLPISKQPGKKGNLILDFHVVFPKTLTEEQKNLLQRALP